MYFHSLIATQKNELDMTFVQDHILSQGWRLAELCQIGIGSPHSLFCGIHVYCTSNPTFREDRVVVQLIL